MDVNETSGRESSGNGREFEGIRIDFEMVDLGTGSEPCFYTSLA